MGHKVNAKKGFIFGSLNFILNLILPFIARTVIIFRLGIEYVGLNSIFSSIINILNITELGIGASLAYLLYSPLAEKDKDKICIILNFAKKTFFVIGIIILAIGGVLAFGIKYLIASNIPEDINIYLLYLIFLLNSGISYLMFSYKRILFSADQRYDIETNISSICILIQNALQITLLFIVRNYYIYAAVSVLATILNNILCQIVSKRKYPDYFPKGRMSKEDIKEVKEKVGGAFLSKLSSTIYMSVDNIIISAFFGLVALGQFNNYHLVVNSLISAFAIIHNTLRPIIGDCIVTRSKDDNFKLYLIIDYVYFWLSTMCTACLFCLFQDFIIVWLDVTYTFSKITMVLISSAFFCGRISCVTSIYIDAAGIWSKTKWIYLLAAIFNLGLNILFAYLWGINGVLISTIATSVLITFIGTTIFLFKQYFDSRYLKKYLWNFFLNIIIGAMITCSLYFLSTLFASSNFGFLVLKGVGTVIVFCIAFILCNFWRPIFKDSLRLVKDFIKKR